MTALLAPPDRLVFLLDHQYSEHSLQWTQLKGEDAIRGDTLAALRNSPNAKPHSHWSRSRKRGTAPNPHHGTGGCDDMPLTGSKDSLTCRRGRCHVRIRCLPRWKR